jgi:hypothetical protein
MFRESRGSFESNPAFVLHLRSQTKAYLRTSSERRRYSRYVVRRLSRVGNCLARTLGPLAHPSSLPLCFPVSKSLVQHPIPADSPAAETSNRHTDKKVGAPAPRPYHTDDATHQRYGSPSLPPSFPLFLSLSPSLPISCFPAAPQGARGSDVLCVVSSTVQGWAPGGRDGCWYSPCSR